MSRIGKKLIPIGAGVTVAVEDGVIKVKGPKGEDQIKLHPQVSVRQDESGLIVEVKSPDSKQGKSLRGLFRSLIANMVKGVAQPYEKKLEMSGVGYKASVKDKKLVLDIGFSHQVDIKLPDDVECSVDKNTITIRGVNKQLVGETAARIRAVRKPEPYKGKGIKYEGEIIRRKAGKAAKTAGAAT